MLGRSSRATSVALVLAFCLFATFFVSSLQQVDDVYSFQAPYRVPNWKLGGDAMIYQEFIRLAEDRQSKTGSFWSENPNKLTEWEASFKFRISGNGRLGADGLAFWYTERKEVEGNVFGNEEHFKGVGVFLDTYDNDKSGKHPYLALEFSDGSASYHMDHSTKKTSNKQGCQVPIRNIKELSTVTLTYSNSVIEVFIDIGDKGEALKCGTIYEPLPPGYYFGFTAATGHLADNHDLYSFTLTSLDSKNPLLKSEQQINQYAQHSAPTKVEAPKVDLQPIIATQKNVLTSIESLRVSIDQLANQLGQPNQAQPKVGQECARLISQFSTLQASTESSNSAVSKRFQEIKTLLSEIQSQTRERAHPKSISQPEPIYIGSSIFGIEGLILVLVIVSIVINVYFFVQSNKERSRKYF